jgi:hypothetical protein
MHGNIAQRTIAVVLGTIPRIRVAHLGAIQILAGTILAQDKVGAIPQVTGAVVAECVEVVASPVEVAVEAAMLVVAVVTEDDKRFPIRLST